MVNGIMVTNVVIAIIFLSFTGLCFTMLEPER